MEKYQYFNGVKFTRDEKTGYYLNSTIRKRIHRYVWEFYNGDIPKGMHVHHKDHDKSNNDISNLELMSASEHTKMHAKENVKNNYEKMIKNLNEVARPKASEWHGSEEGRKWHKEHYQKGLAKFHDKKVKKNCSFCGVEYETIDNHTSKFCSNNCKSKNRRASGIDNIKVNCISCGKEFTKNKYSKSTRCKTWCR